MADDVPAPVPPLLSMDEQEQQKKRLKVESLLGEYAGAGDGEIAARMDDRNDHEAAQATPTRYCVYERSVCCVQCCYP
jgi:hypothetical protein